MQQCSTGWDHLSGEEFCRKGPGGPGGQQTSEWCAAAAKKANRMLDCINKGITSRDKEVIIPLSACRAIPRIVCSVLVTVVQGYCEHPWVQRRAAKMIKGLGSLPYEESLRELGLFSLWKRTFSGNLITIFQHLKGGYKEDGESLFTMSHIEKARRNGYKLLLGRF